MKKVLVLASAIVLTFGLAACGGSSGSSASSSASSTDSASSSASVEASAAAEGFDGTGLSDTGEGTMILATVGGTSEGGKVPQVAGSDKTMMQIGLNYEGGDGTVCTVYVDGVETDKANASERSQGSLTLQGDALSKGVHKVEMVAKDGDAVKVYKSAEYEIV